MEENEQEGIELETINPNVDGIELPYVEEEDEEVTEVTETEESETDGNDDNNTETKKETSLQRGINKERQLRKAAEKKNRELEARILALEEANTPPQKTTAEELIENGVDESIAKSIASAIDKKNGTDSVTKQELADLKFKVSLTEKSKEEGFEDILDYADEIKDLVDKGLTLEQSYYATTYNAPKTANTKSEIERKLEAKMQNNTARKEILGNINSNSGASNSSKTKINATAAEKAIAAAAGISVEDFVALRDMDSVKDYNSYKSRKK